MICNSQFINLSVESIMEKSIQGNNFLNNVSPRQGGGNTQIQLESSVSESDLIVKTVDTNNEVYFQIED
jgi:hypothetical protein